MCRWLRERKRKRRTKRRKLQISNRYLEHVFSETRLQLCPVTLVRYRLDAVKIFYQWTCECISSYRVHQTSCFVTEPWHDMPLRWMQVMLYEVINGELVIVSEVYTVFHKIGIHLFSFYNFSICWSVLIKIILLCSLWIFFTATVFYALNYKIWGMLQDQNQGRPWATKTHCGRMG